MAGSISASYVLYVPRRDCIVIMLLTVSPSKILVARGDTTYLRCLSATCRQPYEAERQVFKRPRKYFSSYHWSKKLILWFTACFGDVAL